MELAGGDELPNSEEVRAAQDELKVLHEEKHKTQQVISTVKKELETAQIKTRKLAEVRKQIKFVKTNISDKF